ncbi:MAG: hypothetical protein ACE361_14965 [Aureliella sp.]
MEAASGANVVNGVLGATESRINLRNGRLLWVSLPLGLTAGSLPLPCCGLGGRLAKYEIAKYEIAESERDIQSP